MVDYPQVHATVDYRDRDTLTLQALLILTIVACVYIALRDIWIERRKVQP